MKKRYKHLFKEKYLDLKPTIIDRVTPYYNIIFILKKNDVRLKELLTKH